MRCCGWAGMCRVNLQPLPFCMKIKYTSNNAMQPLSRQIRTELSWLIASVLVTIAFTLLLFGTTFFSGTVDIQLYDTYFVFSPWYIFLLLFSLTTFSIYPIKRFQSPFNKSASNWILIITAIIFIITFAYLINSIFTIL